MTLTNLGRTKVSKNYGGYEVVESYDRPRPEETQHTVYNRDCVVEARNKNRIEH